MLKHSKLNTQSPSWESCQPTTRQGSLVKNEKPSHLIPKEVKLTFPSNQQLWDF